MDTCTEISTSIFTITIISKVILHYVIFKKVIGFTSSQLKVDASDTSDRWIPEVREPKSVLSLQLTPLEN